MREPIAYLWMFPREDFERWQTLSGSDRTLESYDEYIAELASCHQNLLARGRTVVRVRMSFDSMLAELANRKLPNERSCRAFVLQAAAQSEGISAIKNRVGRGR